MIVLLIIVLSYIVDLSYIVVLSGCPMLCLSGIPVLSFSFLDVLSWQPRRGSSALPVPIYLAFPNCPVLVVLSWLLQLSNKIFRGNCLAVENF